jgi:hypothetical protein
LPTAAPLSAALVLELLKGQHLPIGRSMTYTAENDPDTLLGRPGQSTSKVNFQDTRLPPEGEEFSTDSGGAVEVFAIVDDARRRKEYIEGLGRALPSAVESDYLHGRVLLRLTRRLTPEQAGQYEVVLRGLPVD